MKNIFSTEESVKINWFKSEKYFFTDESVKWQITDSISENLTDSDLESTIAIGGNTFSEPIVNIVQVYKLPLDVAPF